MRIRRREPRRRRMRRPHRHLGRGQRGAGRMGQWDRDMGAVARPGERCDRVGMDVLDLHLQLRLQQPPLHSPLARSVMRLRMASIGLFIVLAACTANIATTPTEPPSRPPTVGVGPEGVGYEHKIGQSRFNVGAGARREVEGPYERVFGDKGAFLVDTVTGATLAVPTRAYPAIPKGVAVINYPRPLTENPDQHTAVVRAYLVGAGVPATQVSGTHVTTTMAGGGPVKGGVQPARSRFLWYSSHLERSVV